MLAGMFIFSILNLSVFFFPPLDSILLLFFECEEHFPVQESRVCQTEHSENFWFDPPPYILFLFPLTLISIGDHFFVLVGASSSTISFDKNNLVCMSVCVFPLFSYTKCIFYGLF